MTEPTLQERLRQVHREITDSDGGESPLMEMIREAADALDAAQAEVERLRAGLSLIANLDDAPAQEAAARAALGRTP